MSEIKIIGSGVQGITDPSQAAQKNEKGSFENAIKEALNDASQIQNDAEQAIQAFANGEVKDIHTVVLAMEKADLSLQTMLQVRNKLLTAYEEIMRMQV